MSASRQSTKPARSKRVSGTIQLTVANAIVKYLIAQRVVLAEGRGAGQEAPLFPGVFAIFGHGNVTCLGHSLEQHRDQITTWRGQNEQGMALAGIAYTKAMRRQQIMVATSSVGPGATNMVTAAGVAMANRLPLLMLVGDTFQSRLPDPVLQQVEHDAHPSTTVNDAFRSVTRYWDRITHPAQVITSLPTAIATMLDPATCGPTCIALPQDVQAMAYDFPTSLFDPVVHTLVRPRADRIQLNEAAAMLKAAKRPVIIAGGGVHYSLAEQALSAFARKHGVAIVETMAGKSSVTVDHPNYGGPVGVTGCDAANNLIAAADLVLAVGTRLQDFTTGSWTIFGANTPIIGINVNRFDATKRRNIALVGDARETLTELSKAVGTYTSESSWVGRIGKEVKKYHVYITSIATPNLTTTSGLPSYAHVVGAVVAQAKKGDYALTAAGGFPGELNNGWRSQDTATFDCEYGFSCMGYEISGGWGAAMARQQLQAKGDTYVFVGDGSYLMMNSDIYSSVLSGHKMTVIVCDNGGYAVIDRLQVNQGGVSFNNLIKDSNVVKPFSVDFAAHAAAMGAHVETVSDIDDLAAALKRARAATKTVVISIRTDPHAWTGGGAFWEVGVPEVSSRKAVNVASEAAQAGKQKQRVDRPRVTGTAGSRMGS
jgi:3D-(3,5/4)-trihydroxycyclohexane-1,2-dione acylhydrolase (decyclizing)